MMIVLFVPIRYAGFIEKNTNKTAGYIRVSWLARMISFRIDYKDAKLLYKIKLFGITILDSEHPRIKKEKLKKTKKEKKKTASESEPNQSKSNNTKTEEELIEVQKKTESLPEPPKIEEKENKHNPDNDSIYSSKQLFSSKQKQTKKEMFLSFWRKLITKIRVFFQKIKTIIQNGKQSILQIRETGRNIKEKIKILLQRAQLIKDFLTLEENKEGIHTVIITLFTMIKHFAPTKIIGRLQFGFDDPCQTGQVLGILSVIYVYYGGKVQMIPNFEQTILEGELLIKGRIRFATILFICIKLILNGKFQTLIKHVKQLKEAL